MYKFTVFFFCLISVFVVNALNPNTQEILPGQEEETRLTADQHFQNNNYVEAARLYNILAFHFWESNKEEQAVENFLQSIKANEEIGNKNAVRHIYNNIGQIYLGLSKFGEAESYIVKSLNISREQNRRRDILTGLVNLGGVKSEAGNPREAIKDFEQALALGKEFNDLPILRNIYARLSQEYAEIGQDEKAREYYDLFATIDRHLQQENIRRTQQQAEEQVTDAQRQRQVAEQQREQTRQQLEQTDQALQVTKETLGEVELLTGEQRLQIDLLDKQNQLHEEELRRKELVQKMLVGGSLVLVLIVFLIFYNFMQKRKANRLLAAQNDEIRRQKSEIEAKSDELKKAFGKIQKQNQDIRNSINYAQRIQNAFLPDNAKMNKYFRNYFIFFKPRDVVSGDFYWFNLLPNKEEELVITAVDCTGHGVPGAFMSLIGMNFLENINRAGIDQANIILEELHKSIRKALKQENSSNQDGMEMSLCMLKKNGRIVEFAGAKNPLFYICEGQANLLKADPKPIGGLQFEGDRREFTSHTLEITKPTSFYMFSDGFSDQFGGPEGRKYSSKRLKELLLGIHSKPMEEQKKLLELEFENWVGDKHKQLDDILVIGFEVDPNQPFES